MASNPTSKAYEGGSSSDEQNEPVASKKGLILPRGTACDICRRRKLRCDGQRPTCSPCVQFNRTCTYANQIRPAGPQSVAQLNIKMAGLQQRLEQLVAQQNSSTSSESEKPVTQSSDAIESTASTNLSLTNLAESLTGEIDDMSASDRDSLFEIVFQHANELAFFVSRERFYSALNNQHAYDRPHPALLNAMLLTGLLLNAALENPMPLPSVPTSKVLLSRTQASLNDSLSNADRLQDYICASELLAYWYFYQGRLQEAHYFNSTTCSLILACRLHKIHGSMLKDIGVMGFHQVEISLLGAPSDSYDLGRRINTFWQSFFLDKVLAIAAGMASSYGDSMESKVTTVWARSLNDYDTGIAFQHPYLTSVDDLLSLTRQAVPGFVKNTVLTTHLQALVLAERAMKISSAVEVSVDVNLNAVLDLQTVVDQLIHKIRVPEDLLPTGSPGAPLESGAVKGSWVAATRALLYISKIYIYRAVSALRSSSPSQENLGWELEFPNNVALRAEAAERAMAELKGTVTKSGAFVYIFVVLLGLLEDEEAFARTVVEDLEDLIIADDDLEDARIQLQQAELRLESCRQTLIQWTESAPVCAHLARKLEEFRSGPAAI